MGLLSLCVALLCVVCVANGDEGLPVPVVQPLNEASLMVSKFLLSNYAVEDKDLVIDYRIYNVGDKAATKVILDDRNNFPSNYFDAVQGQLRVRWDRLAPGANVTHSVIVKPRYPGPFNLTSAVITYIASEEDPEPRVHLSSQPGENYIYRLKDYERKFSPHYVDWAMFALMALPCVGLPAFLWYSTKSKYDIQSKRK